MLFAYPAHMSLFLKLLWRELLVYALPVSILTIYVYQSSAYPSGFLFLMTKVVTWGAILGYHYLFNSARLYTFRNAGYRIRTVVSYALLADTVFITITFLLLDAV
jgi:hypothetical protein